MRTSDLPLMNTLSQELSVLAGQTAMPGISNATAKKVLIQQLIDSIRRVKYVELIATRNMSPSRLVPVGDTFDPIRAAVCQARAGNLDEAFWFVFLAIHFGKSSSSGWRLCRDFYGRLGDGGLWNWATVATDPVSCSLWLAANWKRFSADGIKRGFGNHRKYESLRPDAARGTGAVIESYVHWVGPSHSHLGKIAKCQAAVGGDPRAAFKHLYDNMSVVSFGRTAKFDYLTMIGKLGLANLEADSAYIRTATGPKTGAKLLFFGAKTSNVSNQRLEIEIAKLDEGLSLGNQSMQVLEDAICNWQKSPSVYVRFR